MSYDIYGLGNALVDMEFAIDDGFLRRQTITKGHMTLIDESRLAMLLGALGELAPKRSGGGSAANTVYAAQAFGATTFYACRVAPDATGRYFLADLRDCGVQTNNLDEGLSGQSGRCLVLVTPDAERSMNTFLGVSQELSALQMDETALRRSRYLYIEGYLCTSPSARDAAVRCRELAEANGVKTSLTLSDPSMVLHFRDELAAMLGNGVDHLFCNEEEALDWARSDRLDVAVNELKDIGRHVNITLGARGCMVVSRNRRVEVEGFPVRAVDTTGAGDIYAGACLYGWSHGASPEASARFANFAAAQLVTRYGPRLERRDAYRRLQREYERISR
jgi:fructokinase